MKNNWLNVLTENTVMEVREEDKIGTDNDACENTKEKGIKTNDKVNKIRKIVKREKNLWQKKWLGKKVKTKFWVKC